MKNIGFLLLQLALPVMLFSCNTLSETSKNRVSTGVYKTKSIRGVTEKRYVMLRNDSIRAYPVTFSVKKMVIDTARTSVFVLPKVTEKPLSGKYAFSKKTWDVNFQTILFKFRPPAANIPNQLNTDFNFNLYLGRRADTYRISYRVNPLEPGKRKIDHFGYSFGFFSGLGETQVSSSVTQNQISYIYDGLVWMNGLGAIVGINSFTLGIGLGVDQLLDRNRDVWIYQREPWFGFLLGIKLK